MKYCTKEVILFHGAKLTDHSERRMRKRLGINRSGVERTAQKALEFGVSHKEATGKLCRYMDGIFLTNYRPTNMRVYNRMLYLFRDDMLITVLPIPNRLWTQADKLQQKKLEQIQEVKNDFVQTV